MSCSVTFHFEFFYQDLQEILSFFTFGLFIMWYACVYKTLFRQLVERSFLCAIQCHETDACFSFSHRIWKIKENTVLNFCLMLKFKKNTRKFNFRKTQMYEQSNLMKLIIILYALHQRLFSFHWVINIRFL